MFPQSDNASVYLRSAAKPFQAYPLYQHPNSASITLSEWAIMCSSHSATAEHLALVRQLLERAGAEESQLHCGPHDPLDASMAKHLLCRDEKPTRIHNNCSGKHAGMLLACRWYGWPMENYTDPEHPLQHAIYEIIAETSGTNDIQLGVDGCGAPVFAVPLKAAALLFARLASQPGFAHLFEAMTTYPHLVGDIQRIDSCLMTVSEGNLVAKVGADGFLGIGSREARSGLAFKVLDGSLPVRDRLAIAMLEDLGWLTPEQADMMWSKPQFSRERRNTQDRVVGEYRFDLPWINS
jgi:L-asparaginase II